MARRRCEWGLVVTLLDERACALAMVRAHDPEAEGLREQSADPLQRAEPNEDARRRRLVASERSKAAAYQRAEDERARLAACGGRWW